MEQNSNKNSDISRDIITRYGSIRRPNNSNIEVNIISWNNGRKKLDIRPWSKDGVIAMKGITLGRESFVYLMKILNNVDIDMIDSEIKPMEKRQEAPAPQPPEIQAETVFYESDDVTDITEMTEEEDDVPVLTDADEDYTEITNVTEQSLTSEVVAS